MCWQLMISSLCMRRWTWPGASDCASRQLPALQAGGAAASTARAAPGSQGQVTYIFITIFMRAKPGTPCKLHASTRLRCGLPGSLPDAWKALAALEYLSVENNALTGAPAAAPCSVQPFVVVHGIPAALPRRWRLKVAPLGVLLLPATAALRSAGTLPARQSV